jgi:hypothetical protein
MVSTFMRSGSSGGAQANPTPNGIYRAMGYRLSLTR